MIHEMQDGRRWAPIQTTDTHLRLEERVGWLCEPETLAKSPIKMQDWDHDEPGNGSPLCPACCRVALAMGLLDIEKEKKTT